MKFQGQKLLTCICTQDDDLIWFANLFTCELFLKVRMSRAWFSCATQHQFVVSGVDFSMKDQSYWKIHHGIIIMVLSFWGRIFNWPRFILLIVYFELCIWLVMQWGLGALHFEVEIDNILYLVGNAIVLVLYTLQLVMTDLDAPSRSDPYLREHLHWYLIVKISEAISPPLDAEIKAEVKSDDASIVLKPKQELLPNHP
ncbi:hypothetical protein L1987_23497 [Smallanthus sonchifolius]|uniref:Uncharacterized protein n=1 Tax=Smallanthus sonchifolius TaxID=185202 RepID=A0ACB9IKF9_9ASTR|nr:hypothetical protein L1987_23497 [Smallanthus sonchifolius]